MPWRVLSFRGTRKVHGLNEQNWFLARQLVKIYQGFLDGLSVLKLGPCQFLNVGVRDSKEARISFEGLDFNGYFHHGASHPLKCSGHGFEIT